MSSKKGKKKNLRQKFEKGLDAIKRTLTSNRKPKKHGLLNAEEESEDSYVAPLADNSDTDEIRGAGGQNIIVSHDLDILDPQLEYSQAVNKGSTVNLEGSATSSYDDDRNSTRERQSKVFSGDGCVRPRPRSGNFPGSHGLRPASSVRGSQVLQVVDEDCISNARSYADVSQLDGFRYQTLTLKPRLGYSGQEKRLADQTASRGSNLRRYAKSENLLLERKRLSSGYGSNPDDDWYQSMVSLRDSVTTLTGSITSLSSDFAILQQQQQDLASKVANLPFNKLESEQWDNNSELMGEIKAIKNATQQALKEFRGNQTELHEAMRVIKENEQKIIELTANNANHQTYDEEDDNEPPENFHSMNHDEIFPFADDERF